jgi:hypothetical protein
MGDAWGLVSMFRRARLGNAIDQHQKVPGRAMNLCRLGRVLLAPVGGISSNISL